MNTLLIEGATVVTVDGKNNVFAPGDVICENGNLVYVGPSKQRDQTSFEKVISGSDKIVLPGLINTHTHAAMTLFRSYADDLALQSWLHDKIWPLEAKLTPEAVYWGSLLACLEMLESGVTTFADMYFFMEQTARAVIESGLRAHLSVGLTGLDLDAGLKDLNSACQFVEEYQGQADGRITTGLGPHAPYTCPLPFLTKVLNKARQLDCGVQIHLAETNSEVQDLKDKTGLSPVEFYCHVLADTGPVSSLAAHCVHVSDSDMDLLAKNNIAVAHNPGSNLKLASGVAPLQAMLEKNIRVGLGTDGAASNNNLDLLEEARLAALIHKSTNGDPTSITAQQALRLATIGGAQSLGIADQVGSLETGKKADLIVLNERAPHLYPRQHDVTSRIVYSARASDVVQVLISGKLVVDESLCTTLDRNDVFYQTQRIVEQIMAI